jgi:hypothetical protein
MKSNDTDREDAAEFGGHEWVKAPNFLFISGKLEWERCLCCGLYRSVGASLHWFELEGVIGFDLGKLPGCREVRMRSALV